MMCLHGHPAHGCAPPGNAYTVPSCWPKNGRHYIQVFHAYESGYRDTCSSTRNEVPDRTSCFCVQTNTKFVDQLVCCDHASHESMYALCSFCILHSVLEWERLDSSLSLNQEMQRENRVFGSNKTPTFLIFYITLPYDFQLWSGMMWFRRMRTLQVEETSSAVVIPKTKPPWKQTLDPTPLCRLIFWSSFTVARLAWWIILYCLTKPRCRHSPKYNKGIYFSQIINSDDKEAQ